MTKKQKDKCHTIIHAAAVAASGAATGLAQIPGADNAAILPIQVAMVVSLGEVFGKSVTKTTATSLLSTALASTAGRFISQVLIGWIPGVGNMVNAGTAFTVTEAVGWSIANHFDDEI